jgi:flagellar hook-length control protein FliK
VQTEISENTKMAVDGQASRLSFSAAGDAISETLVEAQTRQISENSQRIEPQTAIKADVEQPANPNSANEGLSTRLPEDVFDIKSAVQKSEMLAVDRLGDKISQIDGESKDSGLLFSQDQMPANLTRLENGAPSTEAAQRGLMSQTLNQIVQKAVLSLHNGQHEVQLHLKPDYLGHIRMQIISEGHQVAIKMVAEFPFVKDMLESNLQQLRADLQAQGLNIDQLEVSVAHDSHAGGNLHQNAEAAKLQAVKNHNEGDDGSVEKSAQTQSLDGGAMAQTAIDYFA